MKKFGAFCAVICFITHIFAVTVNPSLDGRAVVADRGVFPSGNYGKAPGYLPGDTVIVTNHSTGFALEVMILSTSDASEGVAIVLSPEAAAKLNIIQGKDVYVKIQKKQAVPFEKVLTDSENTSGKDIASDPDTNPSKILESSPELLEFVQDAKRGSENEEPRVIEVVPEEPVSETPPADSPVESEQQSEVQEETAKPEQILPVLEETSPLPPEEELTPAEENELIEQTSEPLNEIEAEEVLEALPEEEIMQTSETPFEEEKIEEAVLDETDLEEQSAVEQVEESIEQPVETAAEEKIEDIAVIEEAVPSQEEQIEESPEEIIETASIEPEQELDVLPSEEETAQIPEEEIDAAEESAIREEDKVVSAVEETIEMEEAELIPPEDRTEETAVVIEETVIPEAGELLPAVQEEELPVIEESVIVQETPEEIPSEFESALVIDEPVVEIAAEEPRNVFEEIMNGLGEEVPELIPSDENPPAEQIAEEPIKVEPVPVQKTAASAAAGMEKYSSLIKKTENLEKNKYYIQIATLKEMESIDTVVSSYGKKYPLNLIQVDTKYQVLVGPFSDDEYAVILERFKQKEFKDAFIKKIK